MNANYEDRIYKIRPILSCKSTESTHVEYFEKEQ